MWTFVVKFLTNRCFHLALSPITKSWIVGSHGNSMFKRNGWTIFQICFTLLHCYQQHQSSSCPTSLLSFCFVSFLNARYFNEYVAVLHYSLIHISLMVKNTDHILMCLLATFISSFMKYILKFFAHFLDWAVSPIINILH